MRTSAVLSLVALACGAVAACSGGTTDVYEGPPGARAADGTEPTGEPGSDGVIGDGGRTRDGSVTDGSTTEDAETEDVPPTTPSKVGRIYVGQTITLAGGQTFYSSYATAMFTELPASSGSSSCTYKKVETCHVYDCPLGGPAPDAGTTRYASAGTVSVTGGLTNYSMAVAAGSYTSVSSQVLLFNSGTTLQVSSTGGEVPAFSGKTLTVPSALFNVSSPSIGAGLAIPRSQALHVTWTGANGRDVQVNASTTTDHVRSVSIACTFPGTSSSGSIPAAAMAKLLPTSSTTKGYLSVGAPIETSFTAGSWAVTFALSTTPASSAFTTSN
jgi:hypothetical protein